VWPHAFPYLESAGGDTGSHTYAVKIPRINRFKNCDFSIAPKIPAPRQKNLDTFPHFP
jgi:hypothetical protein